MNLEEFNKVKKMSYDKYCDYLQNKYGIGLANYMNESYTPNPKCKRSKEGLQAHHKMEDRFIMLSDKEYAKEAPYEYQLKENIVYCDMLEHLLLHILIVKKEPMGTFAKFRGKLCNMQVGYGGIVNHLVPELNDMYSGWETKQAWRKTTHDKIINDKDVYLELIKMFKKVQDELLSYYDGIPGAEGLVNNLVSHDDLLRSANAQYGWDETKNKQLYDEIESL